MTVTMMYKVHVGYTEAGYHRWRRFPTLEAAKAYCERVFQNAGVVLAIIKEKPSK